MAQRALQREHVAPSANGMGRVGVPAPVRMKPDPSLLAPLRHSTGDCLTGQGAVPTIRRKQPFLRLAAAERLEQRERLLTCTNGAGL